MSYNSKYTGTQVEDAIDKALSATQPTDIAKVATSGSYNDLKDKPTIPSEVKVDASLSTTSTNPVQNNVVAAGINAKYTKPSTGIPKSDLASSVQTSLGKADTALQSEQYKGTVTGVKINGSTKNPSNGVVDLGTVITSHQDISGKQDRLVSGTNIKTINGTSILGRGNIVIEGGSGGSSGGGSGAYAEVSHGTSDTTFTLTPNTFHVWDEVSSLTLTLGSETAGVANEYLFQFTCGATATSLTLPDDIKWANDSPPTIAENMIYQVSILKGLASALEFSNAVKLTLNRGIYNEGSMMSGATITFEFPVASDLTIGFGYAAQSSYVLPAGQTTLTVEWYEPTAPYPTTITPESDSVYSYAIFAQ